MAGSRTENVRAAGPRVNGRSEMRVMAWIGCFAVTTLVAVLAFSPYVLLLQPQGGYGPIAANHAKYVVGVGGWLNSAGRQIASFAVMDRGWTTFALIAALVLAALTKIGSGEIGAHWARGGSLG